MADAAAERHGQETYFVVGEGILGEALGGREPTLAAALEANAPVFRFSRLGPKGTGKQLGEPNRRKIAVAMTAGGGGTGGMGAGFTYLGQFIDHDLTFDKSGLIEGADVSPADLILSRSPTLDLDSLYGSGPNSSGSAKFYESDGLHLKVGDADGTPSHGFDLPRKGSGPPKDARVAVIPDPRNDENLAVAQTHLAMIRFHNRVVDTLPSSVPAAQRFHEARKIVAKHYQWMIRTDYLPKICTPAVVTDVFNNGRKAFEVGKPPTSVPTMPLEFSVGAFRLGHSMVRGHYNWNKNFPNATLEQIFEFGALGGDLGGGIRLPSIWIADFRHLYSFGVSGINRPDLVVPPAKFNKANRIDTRLAHFLSTLPVVTDPAPENNLAYRNLLRANMLKLATGQQMVTFLKSKGVNVTKLTNAQVRDGSNGADLSALTAAQRTALVTNTPLWFYCLRESELNNGKLGGVGSRIVAETFHRAMEGAKYSIVRDTAFRPHLGPNNTTFRMVDLLLFAFEGKKNLLAPTGD
jgi:Animal haem peroxidase